MSNYTFRSQYDLYTEKELTQALRWDRALFWFSVFAVVLVTVFGVWMIIIGSWWVAAIELLLLGINLRSLLSSRGRLQELKAEQEIRRTRL